MNAAFAVIGAVLVFLAAVIHLGIFALESVLWSRPRVQRSFGVRSAQDAEAVRPWAYNQGFYNVFLAIGAGLGLVLWGTGVFVEAGMALALFSLASMLLAAIVLVTSNPRMWRAALFQGGAPALGLLVLTLSLVA